MKRLLVMLFAGACAAGAHGADLLDIYRDAQQADARFASARLQREAGQEKRIQARAGLLPSLTASAGSSYNRVDASEPLVREYGYNSNSYGLQLAQPLFRAQNWVAWEQGKLATELADVQFGDDVCVVGIGPVGLMSVAGAALHGAAQLFAVGSRPVCAEAARRYGATEILNYREGDIVAQVMEKTNGRGVDRVIFAGGDAECTFGEAVKMLKPGGRIGNVNYLGSGENVLIPRAEWGCGMGHKTIAGGLMPGGRLRMEKLAALLQTGRLDTLPLITHRFHGFEHMEEALLLMKNKPRDLIKPVVILD